MQNGSLTRPSIGFEHDQEHKNEQDLSSEASAKEEALAKEEIERFLAPGGIPIILVDF